MLHSRNQAMLASRYNQLDEVANCDISNQLQFIADQEHVTAKAMQSW